MHAVLAPMLVLTIGYPELIGPGNYFTPDWSALPVVTDTFKMDPFAFDQFMLPNSKAETMRPIERSLFPNCHAEEVFASLFSTDRTFSLNLQRSNVAESWKEEPVRTAANRT